MFGERLLIFLEELLIPERVDEFLNLVRTQSVSEAIKKVNLKPEELAKVLKFSIERRKLKVAEN